MLIWIGRQHVCNREDALCSEEGELDVSGLPNQVRHEVEHWVDGRIAEQSWSPRRDRGPRGLDLIVDPRQNPAEAAFERALGTLRLQEGREPFDHFLVRKNGRRR